MSLANHGASGRGGGDAGEIIPIMTIGIWFFLVWLGIGIGLSTVLAFVFLFLAAIVISHGGRSQPQYPGYELTGCDWCCCECRRSTSILNSPYDIKHHAKCKTEKEE